MKNDQGHGVESNHEINLRQLLNVLLNRRYIIAVLATVLAAAAIIHALILAPIYIAFFGLLLGVVVGVMIVFLCSDDVCRSCSSPGMPLDLITRLPDQKSGDV